MNKLIVRVWNVIQILWEEKQIIENGEEQKGEYLVLG